jgi:hypothetical protein
LAYHHENHSGEQWIISGSSRFVLDMDQNIPGCVTRRPPAIAQPARLPGAPLNDMAGILSNKPVARINRSAARCRDMTYVPLSRRPPEELRAQGEAYGRMAQTARTAAAK